MFSFVDDFVTSTVGLDSSLFHCPGDLVWLVEDSDKRGYYNMGRINGTFEGSDGVIRSAKIRTKDGYYKRPVLKLAPVLSMDEDVFTKEIRAGDVRAELAKLV